MNNTWGVLHMLWSVALSAGSSLESACSIWHLTASLLPESDLGPGYVKEHQEVVKERA